MRLDDGSICEGCENLEHECNVPCGDDDYCCEEYCKSTNNKVRNNFYENDDKIKECEAFKEYKQ